MSEQDIPEADAAHLYDLLDWCEFNAMDWHRALARFVADRERLRGELFPIRKELEQVRAERDEARRNLCLSEAADLSFGENGVPYHPSVAHKIAADYGWDCFKENNNE